MAVAAYTERQNRKFGHPIHAALLGKCGYEYLTVLLGVPCAGGITYPADIQLNNETLVETSRKQILTSCSTTEISSHRYNI